MMHYDADGGRIEIRGFGSFYVKEYDAYKSQHWKYSSGKIEKVTGFQGGQGIEEDGG